MNQEDKLFQLWALLVAKGDFPIPAVAKAKEHLAAFDKEIENGKAQQTLEAILGGAIASGGKAGTGGDVA